PALRPRAVHRQVPLPRGRRARGARDRPLPRRRGEPRRAARRRAAPPERPGRPRRARPVGRPEGTVLMLSSTRTPAQKRQDLRSLLVPAAAPPFPGAFRPLSARPIEQRGFPGADVSGAVIASELGLPDIG